MLKNLIEMECVCACRTPDLWMANFQPALEKLAQVAMRQSKISITAFELQTPSFYLHCDIPNKIFCACVVPCPFISVG